jgi:hypothetical protein
MEKLAQFPDNRLIVSQLSVIELQSVFATKVRMGVIDETSLDRLGGLFLPSLPLAGSRSFWYLAGAFESLSG